MQREVDKQIADLVLDDEKLSEAHKEIIEAQTRVIGQIPHRYRLNNG